jgi:hypothetical protein
LPVSAKQAPVTSPTYPLPTIVSFMSSVLQVWEAPGGAPHASKPTGFVGDAVSLIDANQENPAWST